MYPNELISSFEDGTLNIREFDHKKHVYIAYVYLNQLPFLEAFEKYCWHLKDLLDVNGYSKKFSRDVTYGYFEKLETAMKENPTDSFEQIVDKIK